MSFEKLVLTDKKVWRDFQDTKTQGIRQCMSYGMKKVMKAVSPKNVEDLSAILALYRPGPLQNGMTEMYITNKKIKDIYTDENPDFLMIDQDIESKVQEIKKLKWSVRGVPAEWDEFATTVGEADALSNNYEFSPFSDIISARSCGCISGIIYNQNKLKQLYCKEIKCIQSSIKTGYPPLEYCDQSFSQNKCLYYDGAMTKRSGFEKMRSQLGQFFANQFNSLLDKPVNAAFGAMCSVLGFAGGSQKILKSGSVFLKSKGDLGRNSGDKSCKSQATGWLDVACAIRLAWIQVSDVLYMFKNGFLDSSDYDLTPDTDFCEGLDSQLGLLTNEESKKSGVFQPGLKNLFTNIERKTDYPNVEEIDWIS